MIAAKNAFSAAKGKLRLLGRGKYAALVILLGVLLLLLPDSKKDTTEATPAENGADEFSVEAFEQKLEDILSDIEGAGRVRVVLTVRSDTKRVYVQDESIQLDAGSEQTQRETVIVSGGSGVQEGLLEQNIAPKYQGALVVATGGGDPDVRLKLTQAVSVVTGLGSDKISICKGK